MRCMRPNLVIFAILSILATLVSGSHAQADFLFGRQLSLDITDTNQDPATVFSTQFLVDNTVEVSTNQQSLVNFDLDVSDTNIKFTYTTAGSFDTSAFNGYVFKPVSVGTPAFGSITVNPETTLAGFNSSMLTFDSTTYSVNVSGLTTAFGSVLSLDVSPVPEPSSLISLGLGACYLVGYARRRRKTA
jgi:hypothetical protein